MAGIAVSNGLRSGRTLPETPKKRKLCIIVSWRFSPPGPGPGKITPGVTCGGILAESCRPSPCFRVPSPHQISSRYRPIATAPPPDRRDHAALEKDLPDFLVKLDNYDGEPTTKLAIRLLALTRFQPFGLRVMEKPPALTPASAHATSSCGASPETPTAPTY